MLYLVRYTIFGQHGIKHPHILDEKTPVHFNFVPNLFYIICGTGGDSGLF